MASIHTCVVVLGPYRSGTSLVSQVLCALGVDFGRRDSFQPAPDRYNPGGYFQRRDIVDFNTSLIDNVSGSISSPAHPEVIAQRATLDHFTGSELSWAEHLALYGIKDPRFCATLLSWIRLGILREDSIRIVRVVRDLDAIAHSSVLHREVGSFCDYDPIRAREMAHCYDAHAGWHVSHLNAPVFEAVYEKLVKDPERAVGHLAMFIGRSDPACLRRATSAIGKRRALVRHYTNKLMHPELVFDTARKTVHEWFGESRR